MQNLRDALVWWQTVPEANVVPRLRWYTEGDHDHTDCKTVACFGGWCARWPGLRAQGLGLDNGGGPTSVHGGGPDSASWFFGDQDLWRTRFSHESDSGFTGTDHALVTNRIRWALEH